MTNTDTLPTNTYQKHGLRRTILAIPGALVSAILPVVVGLVLLVSAIQDKPLLSRIGQYVPGWTKIESGSRPSPVRRITAWWGLSLIAIGILQGATEILGGLSLFDPAGFAIRTIGALALEALVVGVTIGYMERRQ
jgi:hypothetical protein